MSLILKIYTILSLCEFVRLAESHNLVKFYTFERVKGLKANLLDVMYMYAAHIS